MRTSVINCKSFFGAGLRIDPDVHLSEGSIIRNELKHLPYELSTVGENASDVFYGNIFSRIYVKKPEYGVPYLAASDTVLANLETGKYLSKKQAAKLSYLMLKKDWILVTCSGTLGNVTYTNKDFENHIATHDLIRIIPNSNKVNKGTLFAFLASKYGYYQITQSQFGGVVKHINTDLTKNIIVPVFQEDFQIEIDDLIQESARLREEATNTLNEAVSYFDNLYKISPTFTKNFALSLKSLGLGFAAYNNNLEVDNFISQYKDKSFQLKDKTTKIFAPPLFKHIYLNKDNGYPFMTGSELTQFNLRYYRWLSPRGVKDINDYVVKKGTLLLYKSGTTDGGILGNVFIADKKLDGCCLSDHVIRINFEDVELAYWTFAFLKSKGAVKMLLRLATGTMIPFITPDRLSEIFIPSPDENYKQIVSLVDKFIDLQSKSKQLEEEAIIKVEQEIEKWNN
ncbi:MAG: restriction endonuclease subunit S [Muribaculaceae bacterium]|nr:restriction endonuclease subunit S [Muribaculaceae bacterium]MBR5086792.1 restriction endonuclease subunit S [Muribaculaceae bacterium]